MCIMLLQKVKLLSNRTGCRLSLQTRRKACNVTNQQHKSSKPGHTHRSDCSHPTRPYILSSAMLLEVVESQRGTWSCKQQGQATYFLRGAVQRFKLQRKGFQVSHSSPVLYQPGHLPYMRHTLHCDKAQATITLVLLRCSQIGQLALCTDSVSTVPVHCHASSCFSQF